MSHSAKLGSWALVNMCKPGLSLPSTGALLEKSIVKRDSGKGACSHHFSCQFCRICHPSTELDIPGQCSERIRMSGTNYICQQSYCHISLRRDCNQVESVIVNTPEFSEHRRFARVQPTRPRVLASSSRLLRLSVEPSSFNFCMVVCVL